MSNTKTSEEVVDPREEEAAEKRREIGRLQREMVVATTPQEPGDPGYQPPYISPELDGEGGTVYRVGDETYETYEDAVEATAPPEADEKPALKSGDDDE